MALSFHGRLADSRGNKLQHSVRHGITEVSEAVVARTRCSDLDHTATLVYRESYCGVLFAVPPDVVPEQATSTVPVPSVPLPFPVKTNTS